MKKFYSKVSKAHEAFCTKFNKELHKEIKKAIQKCEKRTGEKIEFKYCNGDWWYHFDGLSNSDINRSIDYLALYISNGKTIYDDDSDYLIYKKYKELVHLGAALYDLDKEFGIVY